MNNNFKNENNLISKINDYKLLTLVKLCKNLSIAYIALWLVLVVFIVFTSPFCSYYAYTNESIFNILFILLASVGSIFGFALFILGVILIYKTLFLKRFYYDNTSKGLFVWFWIGLYLFGIFSFVGSFLTIQVCRKIKNLNFNELNLINKNEFSNKNYLDTNIKTKKNLLLINGSISYSFVYILYWALVIVVLLLFTVVSGGVFHLTEDADGIVFGVLGFILLFASICLAANNLLTFNLFYPNYSKGINICILFIIGSILFGITSFIGSIMTIRECTKIKKIYFGKQRKHKSINKATKKVLSVTFTAIGSVITIIGVGLVAGTYDSYSNYQKLETVSNDLNDVSPNASNILYNHDIKVSDWNVSNWNNLDVEHRKESVQKVKDFLTLIDFVFPTFGSSQSNIENALTTISSLDPNSNADQGGVIAGSVLLTIGLVALITSGIFLGIFIEKEKKEKKEIIH